MKLFIISGLSGSGKTTALHALEDENFYCVDNLHMSLVMAMAKQLLNTEPRIYDCVAIGIDARSGAEQLEHFHKTLQQLRDHNFSTEVIFLQAADDVLLKRFSKTRRAHPLGRHGISLPEAIRMERSMLSHIRACADLVIDTNHTNVHQLTHMIRKRIQQAGKQVDISLLFQSFGFKHGIPTDSDYLFDVRCLPNPYWEPQLCTQTGLSDAVKQYLDDKPLVEQMFNMIRQFMELWIPRFEQENRNYLTVSIGCTGGKHRSVYMAQRLGDFFTTIYPESAGIQHRELH